eukprot:gene119-biopygen8881
MGDLISLRPITPSGFMPPFRSSTGISHAYQQGRTRTFAQGSCTVGRTKLSTLRIPPSSSIAAIAIEGSEVRAIVKTLECAEAQPEFQLCHMVMALQIAFMAEPFNVAILYLRL